MLKTISVYECNISTRAMIRMLRSGLFTLGDIAELMESDPIRLLEISQFSKQLLLEVVELLEGYGVDCYAARKVYGFGVERREDIAELDSSVRLYNILCNNGLESLTKIEAMIKQKPFEILSLEGLGKKTRDELYEKLEKAGVDIAPLKTEAKKWGLT